MPRHSRPPPDVLSTLRSQRELRARASARTPRSGLKCPPAPACQQGGGRCASVIKRRSAERPAGNARPPGTPPRSGLAEPAAPETTVRPSNDDGKVVAAKSHRNETGGKTANDVSPSLTAERPAPDTRILGRPFRSCPPPVLSRERPPTQHHPTPRDPKTAKGKPRPNALRERNRPK
jgi:hypothetical protein